MGQVLDIEDFLVSNLLLPLGSLVYLLFCVTRWGWGFDKYLAEANTGTGLRMARVFKPYFQFILPIHHFWPFWSWAFPPGSGGSWSASSWHSLCS